MHKWSPEEREYLSEIVSGRSYQTVTDLLNERFGLSLGLNAVSAAIKRYGLTNGRDCKFQKGHESHNKGVKGVSYPGMERTQFRKGHVPHNYRPVGSERVNREGCLEVKVADPKTWKMKHVLIWEKNHGKVPKGCVVIFADENKSNLEPDNLRLITRKQLATMNRFGLFSTSKELTETGILVADLRAATSAAKKKKKEKRHGEVS